MSIESEILRIQRNIADTYAAAAAKGGEVPTQPTSANLAAAVASIPAGAGGVPLQPITTAEYDALPEADKQSDVAWMITDDNEDGDGGGGSGGGSSEEIYSTEEVRIGTWIDGKPLYRRVFQVTSPSVIGVDNSILTLDSNILVKRIDGMLTASESDGSVIPVNFGHGYGAAIACWWKAPSHAINMKVGVEVETNRPVELYLEYTKTTDEPEVTT